MVFQKISYQDLNTKAKELYNFQKVAAILADYGFTCMWLSNDWQGADFIGVHVDGTTDIKVQLKGRFAFAKKYCGKDIFICFIGEEGAYLYPHDKVLEQVEQKIADRRWLDKGTWSTPRLSREFQQLLRPYLL